ncbi:MAG: aldo/keto reductase [Rhizobiales bacterium]|nr:aldo/keto reductase [Hyphomicrobiales bacterium]
MQKRQMGPNGPQVSAFGYGAMSFSNFYGKTTEAIAHSVLDACLELGVDHLDTSNIYGMGVSEKAIGSYLAKKGQKDLFFIATKAGITKDPETGARFFLNSKEHLESELDSSLKRLGVDVIDLFYIHRREASRPIEEVTETLKGFITAGKIKSFGFSEIAPSSLRRAAAIHPVAAVQSEYSLSTRAPELGLVQTCAELGTTLVAFSPVGRGLLTDRPQSPERLASSPFLSTNPRFTGMNLEANVKYMAAFQALAKDLGTSAAALSIAWLLSRNDNVIPIPGTASIPHLKELVAGTELSLSESDLAQIEKVLPVGWAYGDRYGDANVAGPERYC